jgi:hypothetical protein
MSTELVFEFKCPKCNAPPHEHGKGRCTDRIGQREGGDCEGFICDCDSDEFPQSADDDHGKTFSNPCETASCYHCGFAGRVPVKPKGLQSWEKKALEAGWTPPPDRAKELK